MVILCSSVLSNNKMDNSHTKLYVHLSNWSIYKKWKMYLFETCLYYLLQSKDGSNKQERNKNRQNHYHPPVRPVDAFFSLKPTWRFSLRLGSTNPFNFPMFIIIFEFLKNSRESLIMQFNSSNIIKKYCFFMVRY